MGFRGKKVKSLASQLKDLTCEKLFEITDNKIYKDFFEYVWHSHRNGKAWVFFQYTMPLYINYEQYFTSGFTNIDYNLQYGYSEIPKGLIKLCNTYNLRLTNKLAKSYLRNPDAFNIIYDLDINKCTDAQMIDAMIYGCTTRSTCHYEQIGTQVVNENNLLLRKNNVRQKGVEIKPRIEHAKNSYYIELISTYGYNPKLLIKYVDSEKIKRRFKKAIFQDIFDYADMMNQLYDDFDKYPDDLSAAHRQACKEYNRISIDYDEDQYSERNVLDYECEIDGFSFIYPRNTDEIKKEGKNQHNCVATYINRVLYEGCHIMFMRPTNDIQHSYITLEIRDNRIVQAKRKFNNNPSKKEWDVITKWNKKYKDFELH